MLCSSPRRRLQTALIAVIVGWGALEGAVVLASGLELLLKQRPSCPTELYLLEGMQAVARGADLYPDLVGPPYVLRIYNPLAYAFAGTLARALPAAAQRFDTALVLSRVPALLSALLICALLAWYQQRQLDSSAVAALTLVTLLLLHSSTLTDLARNRPETPALLLTLGGWVLAQRRPRRWHELAALCFVIAWLFKQSFLAAPVAVAIELAVRREHAQLKRFLARLALLGAAGLAWCIGGFGDDYFTHAFFSLASNPLDPWERLPFFARSLASHHWGPFFVVAFAGSLAWLLRRRLARGLLIYTAVSCAWTALICSKQGSGNNYFCELSVLLVLCLGAAIGDLRRSDSRLLWVPLACLLAFLAVNVVRHGPGWNQVCADRTAPRPRCDDAARPRGSALALHERRHRADRVPTLYLHEELAVRMGQPLLLDYYLLHLLVEARFLREHLDPARISALIRARSHARLAFPRPGNPWTERWIGVALASGYRPSLASRQLLELTLPRR